VSPRVTVLMSVFNGARYLRLAIDSILMQTFGDFELLIIDDASTDGSAEILRGYADPRIRVLRNEANVGLTRSLNLGLAAAQGDLIARHDADDLSDPSRLALQVAYLDSHPDVALLGSRIGIIDASGRSLGVERTYRASTPIGVRWQLLFGNPLIHSAVMFRRDAIRDELGGYDETMYFNQDFELWSRVIASRSASNHPGRLLQHRVHSASLTRQPGEELARRKIANLESNLAVQRRNVLSILGSEELAQSWPQLWTGINNPALAGHPDQPGRAAAMIDEMTSLFAARYSPDPCDRDLRDVTAAARSYLAEYLAGRGARSEAFGLFVRAVRASPRVAFRAAPRIAAGALPRRILDRIRRVQGRPARVSH
jgi:hypothetical protein